MKALVGSYSGSEVSVQLPGPSRPCARAVNLSPPTGWGGLLLPLSCQGGFTRLLLSQAPWLLPGASPQPVKIQPHKSALLP